ncbi:MAG: VOC family protein [Actinobacteria bacterium]|nr:VOC family protein [Actinomycetota bacterium]
MTDLGGLDHLVYAAPDLDSGCAAFEALTGVAPTFGGAHEGLGTHNALASLGDKTYLEIVAPQQPTGGNHRWIDYCRSLTEPRLFTFCVRPKTSLDEVARLSTEAGFDGVGPFSMSRVRPDGVALAWHLFSPNPGRFGDLNPFYIDWGQTEHPARSTRTAGEIVGLSIRHPQHQALADHYTKLGIEGITVSFGDEPSISATIETTKGLVTLA